MSAIAMEHIPYSDIRKMSDLAKQMEDNGEHVIHMEIGRPNFDTPQHIVEAAVRALREGKVHYATSPGIFELRQAISDKYVKEYNLYYDPAKEIVVTNGVAEAVYLAVNALGNPGDEILVPNVVWSRYHVVPLLSFIHPVQYRVDGESGFLPDLDDLKRKITNRTKMIVLVSPSNPHGMALPKAHLQEIAQLAQKHNLIVISDEIYEKIIYDGRKHESIAAVEGMKERTIVLNGFSKYYSMTGWRVGFAVGPEKYINPMVRLHQNVLSSTTTFAQWGALEALTGDQTPSEKMVAEFEERRNYLVDALNQIPGFSCPKPDGALYVFPSIKETGLKSKEAAEYLLKEAKVVCVAGSSFGQAGEGYLRFTFTAAKEEIVQAVERIKEAFEKLGRS